MLHLSLLILSESESGDLSRLYKSTKLMMMIRIVVAMMMMLIIHILSGRGALQYPQIYQVDRKCSPADRALLFLHPFFQISALSIVEMNTLKEKRENN